MSSIQTFTGSSAPRLVFHTRKAEDQLRMVQGRQKMQLKLSKKLVRCNDASGIPGRDDMSIYIYTHRLKLFVDVTSPVIITVFKVCVICID